MSLLTEAMEAFVLMDRTSTSDGYGGITSTWQEGASFLAAVSFDNSMQARIAGVQGVTSLYTVTTSKAVTLGYHDVIKRVSDGKYFRCTSDGTNKKTPASAGLDMRSVTAEEWKLTGTVIEPEQTEENNG